MDSLVGRRLDRYAIQALLGQDMVGAVYLAQDQGLSRVVALKVIHHHLAGEPTFRRRFMQEAQVAAGLNHPSIVTLFTFEEQADSLYLVMEYVPGPTLGQCFAGLQEQAKRIRLDETLLLVSQASDALEYGHSLGVLHSNIHPDNMLIKRTALAPETEQTSLLLKISDFGLAGLADQMTGYSSSQGIFPYRSPEAVQALPLDERSDVYSLGAVLHEIIMGQPPSGFNSEGRGAGSNQSVLAVTEWPPDTPTDILEIIERALAANPDERFQSAKEMGAAVRKARESYVGQPVAQLAPTVAWASLLLQTPALPPEASAHPPESLLSDQIATLIVSEQGKGDQTFRLDKSVVTIGRSRTNDIELGASGISRQHLRLEFENDSWYISDLGSTNSTLLEGSQLPESARVLWPGGQLLQAGPYTMCWQPLGSDLEDPTAAAGSDEKTAGDLVQVSVNESSFKLVPGERVDVEAEVCNRHHTSGQFQLMVQGLPADWLTYTQEVISLAADETGVLSVAIRPPRSSASIAGRHNFHLLIRMPDDVSDRIVIPARITLAPFVHFLAEIQPEQLRRTSHCRVRIHNNGNMTTTFNIHIQEGAESLRFEPAYGTLRIPPGQADSIDLRVSGRRRPIVRSSQYARFQLAVRSSGTSVQTVTGIFWSSPRITGRQLGLAAITLMLLSLAAIAIYAFQITTR